MQQSSALLTPIRLWRERLSARLLTAVLGMSLLGATLRTVYDFRDSAQTLEAQIASTGNMLARTAAIACQDGALTYGYKEMEDFAEYLLTEPDVNSFARIAFVRIERPDGTVLNPKNAPTPVQIASRDVRAFATPITMPEGGGTLGQCTIWLDAALGRAELRARSMRALLQNVLAFSLLSTVATLLLRSWLGRPLSRLDEAVQRIATGDLEARVEPTGVGELRRFANTLEAMRESLRASHASLAHQNERLRELDRLKDEFIANTSHEIRTPLSSILGSLELLADASATEREELLDAMRRNGSHLLFLINQVLDFSKLQADNLCVELQDVPLRPLLADVVGCFWPKAKEKQLQLDLECAPNTPETLRTDPLRLRQVLMNLVGNALKFTATGSVHLMVRAGSLGDGPSIEIETRDTGPGISDEVQQRLFVPFAQGDATMSRRFGGTGLGLVISRKLAKALGGDISLTSTIGVGTSVLLTLPVKGPAGIATRSPTRSPAATTALDAAPTGSSIPATAGSSPPAAGPALPQASGRVLLVDDAADNRRLLSAMLRKSGVDVTLAEDGQRGCETIAAAVAAGQPFDLVLMDIQMPVLDGHAAARQLRRAGCTTPLIALTAHATGHDREACMEAGFDDYATKPITRAKLVEIVHRYVPPK